MPSRRNGFVRQIYSAGAGRTPLRPPAGRWKAGNGGKTACLSPGGRPEAAAGFGGKTAGMCYKMLMI